MLSEREEMGLMRMLVARMVSRRRKSVVCTAERARFRYVLVGSPLGMLRWLRLAHVELSSKHMLSYMVLSLSRLPTCLPHSKSYIRRNNVVL